MPLDSDAPVAVGEQRGRERLKGAFLIDVNRIRPDPSQPRRRLDDDALGELAASIRRHGIMQAITVRYLLGQDVYQIISGERRYRATRLAGLTTIPCLIQEPKERDVLVRQIVENWQRAQLHPFEIADALAQLRDENGYSQKQLAAETGKPEGEISKLLKLLELSPAVQKDARNDASAVLSFRHLYNVARLQPDEQVATVAAVREQRLSAIETEKLVRKAIERRTRGPSRGAPVTKVEYVTSKAKVTLSFRKQSIDKADILAALDEARERATGVKPEINIVRVK